MVKGKLELTREQIEDVIQLFNPSMDDYLYILDLKNDYYSISSHAIDRFILPGESFYNALEEFRKFVYADDIEMVSQDLEKIKNGEKDEHSLHYRWMDHSNNPVWINCRGQIVLNKDGERQFLIGCINEIGKKQKADNVSGLLGETSLDMYIKSLHNQLPEGYFMQIGIDDFNDINGRLGFKYGDFILKEFAGCIEKSLDNKQKLYRLVADQFMVVDFNHGTCEDAVLLYKKLRQEIEVFIAKNHYDAVFTISAGILDTRGLHGEYDSFIKYSEFALGEAKRFGKNSYYVFSENEYNNFLRKRKIRSELQNAVNHDFKGFEVYYQPIVDAKTYQLVGAEALMRFSLVHQDGQLEKISPVEFIPLLEDSGLIIPTGKWILHQAVATCKKWQSIIPNFKINVNLSYVQIIKSNVFKEITETLDKYKLKPEALGIEVTESGPFDTNPHFTQLWQDLKNTGISLILDDYGTGYSNNHRLGSLYPHYIKIDRDFTMNALSSEYENKILNHIIDMAHSLGLYVCIEGVENKDELTGVKKMDVDFIQGYLFGVPSSQESFYQKYLHEKHGSLA